MAPQVGQSGVKGKSEALGGGWPKSRSHGRVAPGRRRYDTEKPVRPALGLDPRPVAPSSRISPPEPVDAPGNGEIAVGWLWVSTFIRMSTGSTTPPYTAGSGS